MVNPISVGGARNLTPIPNSRATEIVKDENRSEDRSVQIKKVNIVTSGSSTALRTPVAKSGESVAGNSEASELSRAVSAAQVGVGPTAKDKRESQEEVVTDYISGVRDRALQRRREEAMVRHESPIESGYGARQREKTRVSVERFIDKTVQEEDVTEERIFHRAENQHEIEQLDIEKREDERRFKAQEQAAASTESLRKLQRSYIDKDKNGGSDAESIVEHKQAVQHKETVAKMQDYREESEEKSQQHRDEIFKQANSYSKQNADNITGTYVDVSV